MNAYLIGKKGGPTKLADLKGKQVAVPKGSYIHRYLVEVLKKEKLYDSVKIIHLLSADAEAALERGEIDALAAASGAGPQPDAYYEFLGQLYKYSPEIIRKNYPISEIPDTPLPDAAVKQLENTKKFLVEEGLAKKDFNLQESLLK